MKKVIMVSIVLLIMGKVRVNAQLSGNGVYLKGNNLELCIFGAGGFEGVDTITAPLFSGMHPRSTNSYLGFVANPQLNSWATFDGDFFTPGGPENGWGFEIDTLGGIVASNTCDSMYQYVTRPPQMNGFITYSHDFDCLSATWNCDYANGTNLHWKIKYLLHENDLYYTTTVSVTNNTTDTIKDMYYYRTLDPDNNVVLNTDFFTTNTIIRQPDSICPIAQISATQSTPWNSYIGLAGIGKDWKATYGGTWNRYGADLWWGRHFGSHSSYPYTQTVGVPLYQDIPIALSYRIQNFAPGVTETFQFAVVLDSSSVTTAINNLLVFRFQTLQMQ
jgi:hypothetical protein